MLPQYIHMHVAESVLFAGKAIGVLRNPNTASRFHGAAANSQQPRVHQKIQGFTDRYLFSKEASEIIGEELLPQCEADKIESMLRDLKVSIASVLDFQKPSIYIFICKYILVDVFQ